MINILIIFILILVFIGWLFVLFLVFETVVWSIKRIAPPLPSQRKMRTAVICEIAKHYSDAGSAIDIGSGYGGMARTVARKFPKMRVLGVELMPMEFFCSKLFCLLFGPKNCSFAFGDVIKFIESRPEKEFDIAVCYSGTALMKSISPMANKFKVVLSLDFPLPDHTPVRTIKLHKDGLGQHYLYIYENQGRLRKQTKSYK